MACYLVSTPTNLSEVLEPINFQWSSNSSSLDALFFIKIQPNLLYVILSANDMYCVIDKKTSRNSTKQRNFHTWHKIPVRANNSFPIALTRVYHSRSFFRCLHATSIDFHIM